MPEYLTDRRVKAYREVYELAKARIGPVKAMRWMFSGMEEMGGKSPVQAIRGGDAEAAKIFAEIA